MKNALVTGASTGIGRAVALALGKKGFFIYLVARRQEQLAETKHLVESSGGNSQIIVCDLRDITQINRIPLLITNLELLVNVAGVWHGQNTVYAGKDFASFEQSVITDTYAVGFQAPTLLVHGLLPKMHGGSMIINISGTFESGAKGWVPYYASKRALEDFTKGLADELTGQGMYVNCISPSDTATEEYKKYFPEDAKDANAPDAIAGAVVDLYEKQANGKFLVIKKGVITEDGYHK